MNPTDSTSRFEAKLLRPNQVGPDAAWAFVVLPKTASDTLPRRGRVTVNGTINRQAFQATLDPDGQLSHWLQVSQTLREAAGVDFGDTVAFEISPVQSEPEPTVPSDFHSSLSAAPEALSVWHATTTLARLDWIHWIESAKPATTRAKRIADACQMLASGKKHVCCFDPSGFYSQAPRAADAQEPVG